VKKKSKRKVEDFRSWSRELKLYQGSKVNEQSHLTLELAAKLRKVKAFKGKPIS